MFVFHFGKTATVFGLLQGSSSLLAAQLIGQFRMTGVEDTHLTLAVSSIQEGVNSSLDFFVITDVRKKIAKFPFL